MSNSTIGSNFKGVSKGKIKYSGSNVVNTDKKVNVGGTFEGTQEEQSEIEFAEKNELTNTNTQENVDQNTQSTESSSSKVEPYKLEGSETLHIGSNVYNKYENMPNTFFGEGSVCLVKNVMGNVTSTLTCHGTFPEQHRDIGDVTITEHIDGAVNFVSDIDVSIYQDQTNVPHAFWDSVLNANNQISHQHQRQVTSDITITQDVWDDDTLNSNTNGSILKKLPFHINGHMTVFNQEFEYSLNHRAGSMNDVEYLTSTFKKFGIVPSLKLDLKYKDIVKEIDGLSTTDFSTHKLFVCVYMSHGHKNGLVSAADKEFNLRKTIIDPILENKSLNGIPKIFITVACRGDNNYEEIDSEEFDGKITSTANGIDYSNVIVSYSTYEGHVSKRTRSGTYFIQSLCDNINAENGGDLKIHSLFAKVNGKLADMYKQVPVFETSMGDICLRDLASAPN